MMKESMCDDVLQAHDVGVFLSDYCAWLLGCGATCIRVEKNVRRIAAAYGMDVTIAIMAHHFYLSVSDGEGRCETYLTQIKRIAISFEMNTRLSELSWRISDGRIGFGDACKGLQWIVSEKGRHGIGVTLLVAVANACFCRLFGGDVAAMGVVAVATLAGYSLKVDLMRRGVDVRCVFIICAFVSAVLGATCILFSLGDTPSIALGTSVLYLVPGIPFLNSFSDMIYRHYFCAFCRFTDAVVLTCCLSIGLCAGMMLMNAGMF